MRPEANSVSKRKRAREQAQRRESETRAPLFPNKFSIPREREKERMGSFCVLALPGAKHGRAPFPRFRARARARANPVRSFKVVLKCHRALTPESGRRQSTRLISSVVSVNYNETNGYRERRHTPLPHTSRQALFTLLVRSSSSVHFFFLPIPSSLLLSQHEVTFVSRSYFASRST